MSRVRGKVWVLKRHGTMAGWLACLEHHPMHQKVGSIPSQGAFGRQPIDVSLLPLPLKTNEHVLG